MSDPFYPANFAALALNFGEQIYDAHEPETEEQHNRYLLKALSLAGYAEVDIIKFNASFSIIWKVPMWICMTSLNMANKHPVFLITINGISGLNLF